MSSHKYQQMSSPPANGDYFAVTNPDAKKPRSQRTLIKIKGKVWEVLKDGSLVEVDE